MNQNKLSNRSLQDVGVVCIRKWHTSIEELVVGQRVFTLIQQWYSTRKDGHNLNAQVKPGKSGEKFTKVDQTTKNLQQQQPYALTSKWSQDFLDITYYFIQLSARVANPELNGRDTDRHGKRVSCTFNYIWRNIHK